jgi:glycine oxidase
LTGYNYIIAGQGLAGTLLALFLEQAGKSVLVVDPCIGNSSSHIAAGIIHPITGRRIVKSWRADALIPFAEKTYHQLSAVLGKDYYHNRTILEIFTSVKHRNDWLARSSEPGMDSYISDEVAAMKLPGVNMPLGGIKICGGGYLLVKDLLNDYREYLIKKNCFVQSEIDPELVLFEDGKVKWKKYNADGIIFCEGAAARNNLFFFRLPFIPSKGEILDLTADLDETFILNKSLYLLPLGKKLFRAGATNDWNELNNIPTGAAKEKLMRLIQSIITVPFEITGHQAAVRPTVKDRRPFLGTHPQLRQVHIFNGLGTKGVMVAPFFAHQLCEHLTVSGPIDDEVNIRRFS